jgi:hypothetical protein
VIRRAERSVQDPSLWPADHRPWPPPAEPWAWRQTWHDLLFLHWPVAAGVLRSLVPSPLQVQEFSGSAWVAVTPFWMSGVTPRHWPALPALSRFPELNVRTYVTLGDRPGVWFFSLDAGNRLAVWVARRRYRLPYVHARMTVHRAGGRIAYRSVRPGGTGFEATYEPAGPPQASEPGTLAHWLTERYCLYARRRRGGLYRAEIHHAPWPLQPATAEVRRNDMLRVHAIADDGPPLHAHYARRLDVVVWPLRPVDGRELH